MTPDASNPTDIRSIAVSGEDIVAAVETNRTSDRTAVLRVTPPYSGRMRARLHVRQRGDANDARQVLLPPDRLLDDECPPLPHPDDTADALMSADSDFTVDRQHDCHVAAVESWRDTVLTHVRDEVQHPTREGPLAVSVLAADST